MHGPLDDRRQRLRAVVAAALALAVLALGMRPLWSFFADDAYISLRYAERLLAGHGLTWTAGERVEGYSNLLWVLLCAGLGACGVDLVAAARWLGIACTAALLVAVACRFRRTWPGALAAVALAASAPIPVWAGGGLEMPLVLLLQGAALLWLERALPDAAARGPLLASGACFGLACLARPDAPLFAVVTAAALYLHDRAGLPGAVAALRRAGWLLAWPAAAMLGQLTFRLLYHGDFVPNTARVKLGFSLELLAGGALFLLHAWPAFVAWLLPAAGALAQARRARGPRTFPLLLTALALAHAGYFAAIGGDIFPAWRLLMPVLVPLALLTGMFLERLAAHAPRPAFAFSLLLPAALWSGATQDPNTTRAATERWEQDKRAAGELLAAAFTDRQPLLAADAVGALCYYSRLPSLDMFGLNDRAIAREPRRAGAGMLALSHQRGSTDYLLGRAPDLFSFNAPLPDKNDPRIDPEGHVLVNDVRFARGYRCVWFRCADHSAHRPEQGEYFEPLWVRSHGKIGIERDGARVRIPAWLLGSYRLPPGLGLQEPADPQQAAAWRHDIADYVAWSQKGACARLVDGALQLEARRAGTLELTGIEVEPGVWQLQTEPVSAGVVAQLADAEGRPLNIRDGTLVDGATAAAGVRVQLVVGPDVLPMHVRWIDLQRQ